jgi:hypothetical protein
VASASVSETDSLGGRESANSKNSESWDEIGLKVEIIK